MAQLINTASAIGMFDDVPVDASTELSVELSALDIAKAADREIWVKDELTYSITVTNIDARDPGDADDPGLPVLNVSVTDIIVPAIATLVEGSVEIDEVAAVEDTDYTFDPATGTLVVTLGTVNIGTPRLITFRVEKVQ